MSLSVRAIVLLGSIGSLCVAGCTGAAPASNIDAGMPGGAGSCVAPEPIDAGPVESFAPPPPPPSTTITRIGRHTYLVHPAPALVFENVDYRGGGPRIAQVVRHGVPYGFRVFAIAPGSLYDQAGIRNGDVLVSMNGYPCATPEQCLDAYSHIEDANVVRAKIERKGRTLIMRYLIDREDGG